MKRAWIALFAFILVTVAIVLAQVDSDGDGIPDSIDACYNPNAPAGLVSYWGLNDGSGTTAVDSYDANPGTLVNCPVWTTGQVGGALNFDGMDDYVDCGNAANLQLTTGTVSAWIKTSSAGGDYRRIVIKHWAYGMFLKSNVFGIYDWRHGTFHSTGINLADGAWHHVSFTFQNNVSGGTVLYVDGVSVLTTTMTIGNQNYPVTISCSTLPFTGLIDEVSIYNRALSVFEIADHYDKGLAGKGYCEVPDSDGDGIPDDEDNCPFEDATGLDADGDGCIDTLTGLQEIIDGLPDDVLSDEIKNSLVSKVENALKSADKEKDEAAINILQAFINQIEAQRGKKISEEVADMLIEYANNIIAQIEAG